MISQSPLSTRPLFSHVACGAVATDRCDSTRGSANRRKKNLLKLLVSSALAAGPFTAHAIEAKVSGQVTRALMQVDDGTNSELHNVDIANHSTRFRFTGSADMTPGIKAGIVFETEFMSNASNAVTNTAKSTAAALAERHMNVYFQGGFGTLRLGQGDGAANGGIEVDLSGTDLVQSALGTSIIGSAFPFFTSAGVSSGATIGATTNNLDFESRYDVLRYDTPALGPVKIAVSQGVVSTTGLDATEVALWYSGDLGGGNKLVGALGLSKKDAATGPTGFDDDTTGGSISWLSGSGLNVTFASSKSDVAATREGKFSYVKVGYKVGQHAVAVDMAKGRDQAAAGDEAKMTGIGYVYTPTKWADIFAGFKTHSLDRSGASLDDIRFIVMGSRLKF